MRRLTTTLALSALLTPAALADDSTTPVHGYDLSTEHAGRHGSVGLESAEVPPIIIDEWNGRGSRTVDAGSRMVIAHQKRDMQSAIGLESPEVGLPTDPYAARPKTAWEKLEGDFDAVGADLVRAAENGAAPDLQPFQDAVVVWSAQLGARTPFYDLQEYVPPVLERRWARDLWARAIDATVLRKVEELRAAAARGELTRGHFDALRTRLARRAQVLDAAGASRRLERLERRLTEAEGQAVANPDRLDLVPFELEFERQRMQQAIGLMQARRALEGEVRFSDRLRITELAARIQRIQVERKGFSVYPVR